MKNYVLFWNGANRYNDRADDGVWGQTRDRWIVGELSGGFVTAGTIDDEVTILGAYEDVEPAISKLRELLAEKEPA